MPNEPAAKTIDAAISSKLEALRGKALDLSVNNPLVSVSVSLNEGTVFWIVGEPPDILAYSLKRQASVELTALPPANDNPKDENTKRFLRRLKPAINEHIRQNPDVRFDSKRSQIPSWERDIRDKIRKQLNLPQLLPRSNYPKSLLARANALDITAEYDLPRTKPDQRLPLNSKRKIQALLLKADFQKILARIWAKAHTLQEETGVKAFYAAFGLLGWPQKCHAIGVLANPFAPAEA